MGLMLHKGSHEVPRHDLAQIAIPERTRTYNPLPHLDLVEGVERELLNRGIEIEHERLAVNRAGKQFFGVFDLSFTAPTGDFRAVLGLRNSYDKSLPAGIVAGSRVFVCDNLAFSGDVVLLSQKHYNTFDFSGSLPGILDKFDNHFGVLCDFSDSMKGYGLQDGEVKSLLHDVFASGRLPVKMLPAVSKAYFEPPHVEFEPRTAWSLFNGFTEAAKGIRSIHSQRGFLNETSGILREVTGFKVRGVDAVADEVIDITEA